jgi:hypothetical protein
MLETIDDVIGRLDTIVEESIKDGSTTGYFAALYRRVTVAVKVAIEQEQFENNQRMEALDVHFANRYIEAYDMFTAGEPVTRSWRAAFQETQNDSLIVLQHLLLGMNAHISLDLGISTAEVADKSDPLSIKKDFFTINAILGSLINDTQSRLTRFFRPLGIIDRLLGPIDESLSLFSIAYARDKAWTMALELFLAEEDPQKKIIDSRDQKVSGFSAQLVRPPRISIRMLLWFIRRLERGDVASRIRKLN